MICFISSSPVHSPMNSVMASKPLACASICLFFVDSTFFMLTRSPLN
jgi:hypothetical protein